MKKMIDNIRKYLPVVFLFVLLFFLHPLQKGSVCGKDPALYTEGTC